MRRQCDFLSYEIQHLQLLGRVSSQISSIIYIHQSENTNQI